MRRVATLSRFNPFQIARRVQHLFATLDRLPELQTKVEQCMLAYQKDARYADRLPAFRSKADAPSVVAHVRAAVSAAPLECDPCPHLVVSNLVPEWLYDEILSAVPSPVFFKQESGREEMQVPFTFAPAYSRLVWDFFFDEVVERAVLPSVVERFEPALDRLIHRYWPALQSWRESNTSLRVSNSRLLLRRPGYEIKPHRDPRWAFVTCLIYLQKRNANHVYGTQLLRLCQEREPTHSSPFWVEYGDCELVKSVPGTRNTALIFLNTTGVHAASIPPDAPAGLERYVYQVQFGPDEPTKERLIRTLSEADRPGWTPKRGRY